MNITRNLTTPLLTIAALAILASACSGGGSDNTELAGQVFEMPAQADIEARELTRFDQAQELVANCMMQAGHEYIIPDADRVVTVAAGGFVEVEADTAADLGYGISIALFDESVDQDQYVDPNELYLRSITESERAAWQASYAGDEDIAGCASAGDTVFQQLTSQDALLAKYADQLQEIYDRAAADTQVTEANASWVACMQNQGFYDYDYPEEAVYDVQGRYEAQAGTDDADAQAELQKFEREVATADALCPFNNFGGWERTMQDVYAQYEEQFVAQHSEELLAYLAAEEA